MESAEAIVAREPGKPERVVGRVEVWGVHGTTWNAIPEPPPPVPWWRRWWRRITRRG